jgi:hypothetical protein
MSSFLVRERASYDDAPRGKVDARRESRGSHEDAEDAALESALHDVALVKGKA